MAPLWLRQGHLILRALKELVYALVFLEAVISPLQGYFSGKGKVELWLFWLVSHHLGFPLQREHPLLTWSLVFVLPRAHLHGLLCCILISPQKRRELFSRGKNIVRGNCWMYRGKYCTLAEFFIPIQSSENPCISKCKDFESLLIN